MNFPRQYASYKKRVKNKWRKPRGIDSKQKKGKKDKGAHPKIGYSKAKKERVKELLVRTETELDNIKEGYRVRIAKVGLKKKKSLLAIAEKKKLKVING